MADFPTYLILQTDSFNIQAQANSTETVFEDGYSKVIVNNTQLKSVHKFKYYANNVDDFNKFLSWFQTDIKQGTSFFIWFNPIRKINQIARLADRTYNAIINEEYNDFDGGYFIDLNIESWS